MFVYIYILPVGRTYGYYSATRRDLTRPKALNGDLAAVIGPSRRVVKCGATPYDQSLQASSQFI